MLLRQSFEILNRSYLTSRVLFLKKYTQNIFIEAVISSKFN